jgi:autotransporter-associated beta strand protein
MTAQIASAVLITNAVQNTKGIGVAVSYAGPTFTRSYDKPNIRCDQSTAANKLWIGWDLASAWSFYGQSNLVNASFTYWGENGTTRSFWVAALKDSEGLDGWDQATVDWTTAPGNTANVTYPGSTVLNQAFDWTKCYLGTNIWQGVAGGVAVDVSNPSFGTTFDQAARYTTTNVTINGNLTTWLKTDTDGKVTLMASGGNNQNWWVGTNGYYVNDIASNFVSSQAATLGQVCRGSPTLTLIFDVRVALGGGGIACPGGSGVDVFLGGTDTGNDYLLYTNGIYTGLKVAGTGAAVSFGLQNVAATYTVVESNVTTTVTRLIPGEAVVGYYGAPSITVQPASFTAATNTIARFSLSASNLGGGLTYQWYLNGTPLSDDGRHAGTTSSQLTINPVLATDAATTANGYYCIVGNPCGVVATSSTNALTIGTPQNLIWLGAPTNLWDIATSVNWSNSVSASLSAFNQGDNVTLNDSAVNTSLVLGSPILSPGVITFNHSGVMGIGGVGSIAGAGGSLVVNGATLSSQLVISNANSFAGGTTINDGWLVLRNIAAAGSGTITMAGSGLSLLQTVAAGGANAGYPGMNVLADCTVQIDGGGAYAGSFVGPITGTAGKKLTLQKPAGVSSDNIRFWNTNFTCDVNIDMNIGAANFATYNDTGLQTYNGVISGAGVLFTRQGGRIALNGANTFTGGTRLSAGTTGIGINSVGVDGGVASGAFGTGPVTIEGNVGLFSSGGAHTLGNSVVYTAAGGVLTFTDTNVLTLSGGIDLGSGGLVSVVDRTISAAAGAVGVLSGNIVDNSGLGCGLIKSGSGTVQLNGANTYAGNTTVNAGSLGGVGSIAGPVVVNAAGSLAPGASIGTLTINNSLTVNGTLAIEVNKSLAQSNDVVQVSGALSGAAGGKVTVSNLGAALNVGDRFVLFPGKTMTGGSALTVSGAGVVWTNKLEVDGSIQVLSIVPTTPTQITSSLNGNTLNLSWPSTHIGWSLQRQINALNVGLSTNWVTVPGYEATNSASIAINPASPTVFYRLFYQTP